MKLHKPIALAIITTMLVGCSFASKVVHSDERSVTVDHNFDLFNDAMGVAKQSCSAAGKAVRHEFTSCQSGYHRCISTFTCY